ncbi:DUF1749 domain containing protein [Niveomyces insectorum RCEF 264]|uniref:DUF1749 domain containing protein n=1 Tax=Niveomyces insectorum RCEF 264 TaxID=1081102 RepID=A0A167ZWX9_9HYPO|nr:DUF1749 domain containing protein [Niveomyces insectorum RCEF 264]
MASSAAPFPVLVHPYDSPTRHACAYELATSTSTTARHAVVFIGGLSDGPHTVPYVRTIAGRMASAADVGPARAYSVFELRMASSFDSYGFKRLSDDVADLAALVRYLRSGLGRDKIVFVGHSTGCQDCMAYAASVRAGKSPAVDGYVLQGPVSDREAFVPHLDPAEYARTLAAAERMIAAGQENDLMRREDLPAMIDSPHTAGDDDYFSTDLPDARLAASWSCFDKPVLVLPSEQDEHVPASIDVVKNMARWKTFCAPGVLSNLSGLIPGASHSVEQPEAQLWMADRVIAFLASLE